MPSSLLWNWSAHIQRRTHARFVAMSDAGIVDWPAATLHPFAAEIVGMRLMGLLGIGTSPEYRILTAAEARASDRREWIAKTIAPSGRLHAQFGRIDDCAPNVFLVRRIPGAIPFAYLCKFFSSRGAPDSPWLKNPDHKFSEPRREMIAVCTWGKEAVPNARDFYSDFEPPEDWSAVARSIAIDSAELLQIYAARAFLTAGMPHAGNLLVNGRGAIFNIDFESTTRTDHAEIEVLFKNVPRGTRAFAALAGIAALAETQIAEMFECLPPCPGWPDWPLGSKAATIAYYLNRLRRWKSGFTGEAHVCQ